MPAKTPPVLLAQDQPGIRLAVRPDYVLEEELDQFHVVDLGLPQDRDQVLGYPWLGQGILQYLLQLQQGHIVDVDLLLFQAPPGTHLSHPGLFVEDVDVLKVREKVGKGVYHYGVLQVL